MKRILAAIGSYITENRLQLPIAIFGGALATLAAVTAAAAIWGPPDFWRHVLQRNLELHLMAGAGLYLLFQRLVLMIETRRRKMFGWFVWFIGPVMCVMAISLTQEYGLSLMGESRSTFGGDWQFNKGSAVERAKSLADNATWLFGSLAAAWASYFAAVRNETARNHYLAWKHQRTVK